MPRLLPLGLLLALASGCADPAPRQPTEPAEPHAAAPGATSPATSGDAALADPLPVEPPPVPIEPPPRRMPGSDASQARCDAEAARAFVGRAATAEVVEQARQAAGAELVRTLAPGQVITLEYHASRLNLHVDAANVIVEAGCG